MKQIGKIGIWKDWQQVNDLEGHSRYSELPLVVGHMSLPINGL